MSDGERNSWALRHPGKGGGRIVEGAVSRGAGDADFLQGGQQERRCGLMNQSGPGSGEKPDELMFTAGRAGG